MMIANDDGYDATDNGTKCYGLALRELRLQGIRSGKYNPNPDDPEHYYDYRRLFNETGSIMNHLSNDNHLPSEYKTLGHPNLYIKGRNTKTETFQQGGQLGSTLGSIGGMALGSIIAPGVGTTIGGMLGGKAGNFVQNQFMNGGQSPLNQSNMNNKLTHYKGDPNVTDGINIGNNIKVDHNETNHKGYIYSDTLQLGNMSFAEHSKKIESKYSKRPDDKISKESKERELGNLAKIQEATGLTNQGNQMWSGGWMKNISSLANQANDFSNYTPNAKTGPLETPNQQATGFYTSDDINSNKEAVGNIANTLVTQPTDKAVIQGTIEDERTRVGLHTTSPTLNKPAVPTGTPNSTDGTTPLQTDVNPLGFLASNIGPAFDILQGLKGGDDVQFDRIKQTYANPNPAITSLDNTTSTSFNNARNAIRNNASSSGEYLAMMNNLSGSESLKRGLGKASIKSEYDKINSGTANQISAQNAGIQMNEADARQMETDAARSSVSQGLHNIGANTLGFGQDLAANKTQNTMLPMLSDGYEYYIKEDGTVASRRKKGTTNSNYQFSPKPE